MAQTDQPLKQGLRINERNEAEAFDRVAAKVDRNALRTSEKTFLRYRSATLGKPLYQRHPDLMFSQIGRLFQSDKRPSGKPLQGIRVLDLGAGDGSWSVILAEQGAEVVSVEISPKQVDLARERMSLVNIVWDARVGSAFQLGKDFPPSSFDLVFGQGVLHHLTQDLQRVVADSSWLLRKGGFFICTEPVIGSPRIRAIREKLSWLFPLDSESPNERPLFATEIHMLSAYFPRIDLEYFDVFSKFVRRIPLLRILDKVITRLDEHLLKNKRLTRLASMVFIVAQK